MFLLLSLLLCTKSLRRKMIESLKKIKIPCGVGTIYVAIRPFLFFLLFILFMPFRLFFLFVSDFSFQLRTSLIDTRSRA